MQIEAPLSVHFVVQQLYRYRLGTIGMFYPSLSMGIADENSSC